MLGLAGDILADSETRAGNPSADIFDGYCMKTKHAPISDTQINLYLESTLQLNFMQSEYEPCVVETVKSLRLFFLLRGSADKTSLSTKVVLGRPENNAVIDIAPSNAISLSYHRATRGSIKGSICGPDVRDVGPFVRTHDPMQTCIRYWSLSTTSAQIEKFPVRNAVFKADQEHSYIWSISIIAAVLQLSCGRMSLLDGSCLSSAVTSALQTSSMRWIVCVAEETALLSSRRFGYPREVFATELRAKDDH
ncbi:uncharacterized protein MELLADRAFT_111596 [Melampsora larici-populina 98AG31]|uniref:Uncharacterized protein n=1 Tax=Melampsora larici-populina (strain 98AG31 / pathotype 3-4-7) TaxID=747676 RepID=F4S3Q2_MELLP|nr:uncharacterized protein MELLADRAFT_111596 [Melampsora larici-populina 98AG31]EGG00756.1 hypothetical protein MELLADRAFT_111596 [Melampsora larici-populina 98AG31]